MLKRPKKTKYNKYHKGRISYNLPIITSKKRKQINRRSTAGEDLKYVLTALEPFRMTSSQMNAGELAIKRELKNFTSISFTLDNNGEKETKIVKAKFKLLVFPHLPVTSKPAEVRMGKGKGSIEYWMTRIKIGTPIYELSFPGSSSIYKSSNTYLEGLENRCDNLVKIAFEIASSKLPVKTKVIKIIPGN